MNKLNISLTVFENEIKIRGYNQSDLEYFDDKNDKLAELIETCKKPVIILWCNNNCTVKEPVSLASIYYIHSEFNVVFIDRLAKQYLPDKEILFMVGHELGHAIEDTSDECIADRYGIRLTSELAAISLIRKLSLLSNKLSDQYLRDCVLDLTCLEKRVAVIENSGENKQ